MVGNEQINKSILDGIGNTALIELRHVVPPNHARILAKLESENPTGSMKDRMALAMIEEYNMGCILRGNPFADRTMTSVIVDRFTV